MNTNHHPDLAELTTPRLLLDETRMDRNIQRMQRRIDELGVAFRPHVKTTTCVDIARRQAAAGARGITVSTLMEARMFHAAGFDDILYAVAIAPARLDEALELARRGCRLTLVVASVQAAEMVTAHGRAQGHVHDVIIEIDTDGHRAGLNPDDAALPATARALTVAERGGARLKGVMTHAGSSYGLDQRDALIRLADVVSVGSTPTALAAMNLDGVTEVRAGVYVFFDLVMAGTGVCRTDDIALSVLTTVIGHRVDTGWLVTDSGWMAMSRDRGTQRQAVDHGYGLVCDVAGTHIPGLSFAEANQEHGVLHWQGDPGTDLVARFPVGTLLRMLPNHACATGAQHGQYTVIDASAAPVATWERFRGW
jgi:D-serine deaminase-like pyridoxal phosphate-dependent protein